MASITEIFQFINLLKNLLKNVKKKKETDKTQIQQIEANLVEINAKVGDSLLLSSVQFKSVTKAITSEDLSSLFFVTMHPIMNELKEVVVKRPSVSAE